MTKKLTVALAAGGTGGHIFPAKALAETLKAHGHDPVLITDKRSAGYGNFGDLHIEIIPAAGSGKGIFGRISNAFRIVLGMAKASYLLHMTSPDVVVGFGGYPSFPTMMAATRRGYKTIIHEQNSVLGRVNKHLSASVSAIATSLERVSGVNTTNENKITLTGNPVREAVKAVSDTPYPDMTDGIHILVTGGSQGARVFATLVPEALQALPESIRAKLHVAQQCRKEDVERVTENYKAAGIDATIATFFEDIPARLAGSHLVICRAGASTLAEVAIVGRPAIFVPYPYAMDDHQRVNAEAIAKNGGAWVFDEKELTPALLTEKLIQLFSQPEQLANAAAAIKAAGQPEAAEKLLRLVEKVAGK